MDRSVISQMFCLLADSGVKYAVCSPGSRNAALLQEADEIKGMHKLVIIDERSAAFMALGMAVITKSPVALICTSGSALLNYAPALAEAYYQGIPLIVISADRPAEWIDQDDSQTIRQPQALDNFIKASYDIEGDRNDETYLWYVNRIVNEGMLTALNEKRGPVHFNIHLNGSPSNSSSRGCNCRRIEVWKPTQRLANGIIADFEREARGKKIMLVAGFMLPDNKLQKAVSTLSQLGNVVIMAETVSNLHLPEDCYMVDTALFPLPGDKVKDFAPDILISIGGALISRKLKEFLRNNPPQRHWSLSYSDNLIDCFQSLTDKIECNPAYFINSLANRLKRTDTKNTPAHGYSEKWRRWREASIGNFNKIPWSDLKALKIVFDNLPADSNVFLSNGTSVRYGQIIPYRKTHATYSNRGVSGIEGCTSTAIGMALVYDRLTCLITGDMSFAYDIGGVASSVAPPSMRIIVLDNGGGDIFRFIKATKDLEIRERYLCVQREIPVEGIADSFGWGYFYADSEASLRAALDEFFFESPAPLILHLDTRKVENNAEILSDFLKSH